MILGSAGFQNGQHPQTPADWAKVADSDASFRAQSAGLRAHDTKTADTSIQTPIDQNKTFIAEEGKHIYDDLAPVPKDPAMEHMSSFPEAQSNPLVQNYKKQQQDALAARNQRQQQFAEYSTSDAAKNNIGFRAYLNRPGGTGLGSTGTPSSSGATPTKKLPF
jgi:hypothetical protein